ncbi:DUF2059 domain-containing protein [Neisseria sp. 83E34]|uniref:DUF2059 domain-containing protein n=1 Tax=Neisseria sp. 83E34 TaxID=1692264 RepID=UPI0006CE740B|nr:DUF2059 domain-containing protein [Neisseria sp. 83E34]KPN71252.1 hypothetical protein AKG09_07210 [Neisseria sp. 83E34]
MKKALALTTFLFAATFTYAATPSDASLERLLEVQQFDKILDDSFKSIPAVASNTLVLKQALDQVPAEKQDAVKAKVDQYIQKMTKNLDNKKTRAEIRRLTIQSVRTIYTQEEVDTLIAFYSTPIGQSINAKTPRYMEVVMTTIPAVFERDFEKFDQKYGPKLKRDINQIVCGKNVCN